MRVLIIGAGLGGLCLAQGLVQSGVDVKVFERNAATADGLPGYGIHLDPHGWQALRQCLPTTAFDRLDAQAGHAGARIQFHDEKLRLLAVRDAADLTGRAVAEVERRSIGRLQLRELLLDGLDHTNGPRSVVRWSREFVSYEHLLGGAGIRAHFADGSHADGDVLIGADASHSRVRRQYLPNINRFELGVLNIAGRYALTPKRRASLPDVLTDGSINNIVPPDSDWMFVSAWNGLPKVSVSRKPLAATDGGGDYVVWAYAAARESYPAKAEQLTGAELRDLVLSRIADWAPDLRTLVADADVDTVAPVPLRSMPPLPYWKPSNVSLLGDAIHNMTPMAGIGANTALRDAALLATALADVAAGKRLLIDAIGAYEAEMREYANAAVSLSLRNARSAASSARWTRFAFRTMLRLSASLPFIKRRMFAE